MPDSMLFFFISFSIFIISYKTNNLIYYITILTVT